MNQSFRNMPGGAAYVWKRQFSEGTLTRGWNYYLAGRVQKLKVDGTARVVAARVRGSSGNEYSTGVKFIHHDGTLSVRGTCSCPIGFNCKHCVAVLCRVSAEVPGLVLHTEVRVEPQLSPQAKAWIAMFSQVRTSVANTPPPKPADEVLVWMLDLASAGGGVRVGAARRQKRDPSRFNKGRAFYSTAEALTSGVASEEDIQILVGAARDRLWRGSSLSLAGPQGIALLEKLVATGRLLCNAAPDRALKRGGLRKLEARWVTESDGSQRAAVFIDPSPAVPLLLDKPWYLDLQRLEIGEADSEMSSAALARWGVAPVLAREEVELFMREATEPLSRLRAPLPVKIETVTLDAVRPVPVLRLSSVKDLYYAWRGDKTWLHNAALSFIYADAEVPWETSPPSDIRRSRTGRLEIIPRDLAAESDAQQQLLAAGMNIRPYLISYRHGDTKEAWSFGDEDEWIDFLSDTAPRLRAEGWRIEPDDSFQLKLLVPEGWFTDIQDKGSDWFGVDLGILVDGKKIPMLGVLRDFVEGSGSRTRLTNLLENNEPLLLTMPDGSLVSVPAEKLRLILGTLLELGDGAKLGPGMKVTVGKLRAAELATFDDSWSVNAPEKIAAMMEQLRAGGIAPAPLPEKFICELRPYQHEGYSWLQFLRAAGLNGVLADDMGLGKTVQTIAHLLAEVESGRAKKPSLVVAPTSLMTNWRREIERFAPSLRVLVSHGLDRKQHHDRIPDHDVVITSYSLLKNDREILTKQPFHIVVLDEAQFIKNPESISAQTCGELNAAHRICLTGTPLENHLGELWSLFHFLQPGFLGSQKLFSRHYRTPIEKRNDAAQRERLVRRIRPFLLRRTKEQVAADLPPKTEIVRSVELEGSQRDLYETIRVLMQKKVMDALRQKGIAQSHIIVLDALLKLRQVCCDPRLVKLDAAKKVKDSAKLDLLFDLLPSLLEEGRRILLFSQFTSMLELIEKRLAAEKIPWVKLTGETTDRSTPVDRFQRGEIPLFLISLKAGGTGLNLTAADTVIHYDPWWNPAVENQATDRAHRIGQDKPVFVYKLLTSGTVEEKITALQQKKAELARGILEGGDQKNLRLTEDLVADLLAPIA